MNEKNDSKTNATINTNNNEKGSTMNKKQNSVNAEELHATIQEKTAIITEAYANYKQNEAAGAQYIYEMGNALTAVRNAYKLLDNKNVTEMFKTYCKDKCGFSKAYGYFLISDAKVQDKLEALGLTKIKQGDHQLRLLTSKNDEELKQIWQKVTNGDTTKYVMISELEAHLPKAASEMLKDKVLNNTEDQTFINMVNLIRHIHSGTESVTDEEKETVKTLMMKCLDKYLNGQDTKSEK